MTKILMYPDVYRYGIEFFLYSQYRISLNRHTEEICTFKIKFLSDYNLYVTMKDDNIGQ